MAVSMIGPKFYAWDRNGKPLAFGKLYTYQARTNVPKATYQSEDQVVENTNPVILNGEGYADIYLDGSYKMVLKDSNDNEIWSSDPVTSVQVEEWNTCLSATYLSPTSFKVTGNYTSQYKVNRVVRIDNNEPTYGYSVIASSVYANGETTITVQTSAVKTGIVGVCRSIVGPESTGLNFAIDTDKRYSIVFDSLADMISGVPTVGGSVSFEVGQTLTVRGNRPSVFQVVSSATPYALNGGLFAKLLDVISIDDKVQYVAHRGLSRVAPENTLPAYEHAGKSGFFGCECDVQITSDDQWILMHDDTVDRTTDGTGLISEKTLAQIKALDAGSWFSSYYAGTKVPTLREYLFTCKKYNLTPVIEIKSAGVYSDAQITLLINDCVDLFPDYSFYIISFSQSVLTQVRRLNQYIKLQYVTGSYSTGAVDFALSLGRCIVDANFGSIPSDISYANDNGILLNAWTINDPDSSLLMLSYGVKQITTDYILLP